MSKYSKLPKAQQEHFAEIFFNHYMPAKYNGYIDTRVKPIFNKWLNARFKKQGINAYDKTLVTSLAGNKTTQAKLNSKKQ